MARLITIQIDDRLCQVCQPCAASEVCTVRAIMQIDPDESPYLDVNRCYDCRLCLPACPHGAIGSISPIH